MAKLPVFAGTPKVPLFITSGGVLVPAVATDPCDCCAPIGCNDCDPDPTTLSPHGEFPECSGFGGDYGAVSSDFSWALFGSCPRAVSGWACEITYAGSGGGQFTRLCVSRNITTGVTSVAADYNGVGGFLWYDEFSDIDGSIFCAGGAGVSIPDISGNGCGDAVIS